MKKQKYYPEVSANPSFPEIEEQVLKSWREKKIFEQSVDNRPAKKDGSDNEFIFYDGPPFANGLPHYGHLLTGFVKDIFARYQTIKGKRVERRFGWDCHGLPAEMGAEKELGISGRHKIVEFGIDKFNDACRTSVMKYSTDWEKYVDRQARWVDFKNDYKTMDTGYMESVLWAFKQLYDKGLVYESMRVMPYSWACETPLSNFETRMDNAYRERADKAVTVAFTLNEKPKGAPDADEYKVLAWTTTPWTLPSNLALAVGEGIEYACVVVGGDSNAAGSLSPLGERAGVRGQKRDDQLIKNARELRKNSTEFENKLWGELRGRRFDGYKFRRQHDIDKYIVDFICLDKKLVVELDGGQHNEERNKKYDEERTKYLELHGYRVLRFWNNEVNENFEGVLESIYNTLSNTPHPSPLPKGGEGTSPHSGAKVCYILAVSSIRNYLKEFDLPNVSFTRSGNYVHLTKVKMSAGTTAAMDVENIKINYFKGSDLIGLTYKPLFPYFADHPDSFRILAGDFVAEGDGTGVVHLAPGFGEDDQRVCDAAGIKLVCPVDNAGRYNEEIFDLSFYPEVKALKIDGVKDNTVVEITLSNIPESFPKAKKYKLFSFFDGDSLIYTSKRSAAILDKDTCYLLPLYHLDSLRRSFVKYKGFSNYQMSWHYSLNNGDFSVLEGSTVIKKYDYVNVETNIEFLKNNNFDINRSIYLEGLNVIAETKGKRDDEPYKEKQLQDNGLVNLRIISYLKASDKLVKTEDYIHNYPHCWRTDTPLIYKAVPSWYVEVTKFKDRMVELNRQINWIPGHIRDGQFGKWLENARDWSISRNRFWGAPIPIWRSDNPKNKNLYVFGSIKELEEFFETKVEDLHRPFIDTLTKPDPEDKNYTLRRVEDVFDCWFESGSMPYAQAHYPFENKEWFENHFPADFIVEYVAQTRGWFYTLMVLSTALFDRPPFMNVICHGVVLDDKGQKLSKRLNNYADPMDVFDKFGSDAMRWVMVSAPIMHGGELLIDKEGNMVRDAVRLVMKPIWNSYSFFCLYANADGIKAKFHPSSDNLMDRYILAKCKDAVYHIEKAMDSYDTPLACKAVEDFFEVLNNWYIRRNKERFWRSEHDADKFAAYNTLYSVLHIMCRAISPLLPLLSEEIWLGLGEENSVHLADFPDITAIGDEANLMRSMDRVRDSCNIALSIRGTENIRVRQPLASMIIIDADTKSLEDYADLIKDEVNVKEVRFCSDIKEYADLRLKVNFPVLGKRLPNKMKDIIAATKKGEWKKLDDGRIEVSGEVLEKEECSLALEPKAKSGALPLSTNDALVVLDLYITDELKIEGVARDLVRLIQQSRKDADLNITDRINLNIETANDDVVAALSSFGSYIAEQTLATSVEAAKAAGCSHRFEQKINGGDVVIGFSKN